MKTKEQPVSFEEKNCPGNIEENWRIFPSKTKTGRLLARLYDVEHHGTKINYPKLKVNKQIDNGAQHRQSWRAVNAKYGSTDPCGFKFDHKKAKSVQTPKFGGSTCRDQLQSKVDVMPKRKSKHSCEKDLIMRKDATTSYRPPNKACLNEYEKNRLSDVFACKGGSALPQELVHPTSATQAESKWEENEHRRIAEAKRKRTMKLQGNHHLSIMSDDVGCGLEASVQDIDPKIELKKQLVQEIEDRRKFQNEMEVLGAGSPTRTRLAQEISSRMFQLSSLDTETSNTPKH